MSNTKYMKSQLNQLFPVDEYGVSIKLRSSSGETKWLLLNKDEIETLKEYLDYFATARKGTLVHLLDMPKPKTRLRKGQRYLCPKTIKITTAITRSLYKNDVLEITETTPDYVIFKHTGDDKLKDKSNVYFKDKFIKLVVQKVLIKL